MPCKFRRIALSLAVNNRVNLLIRKRIDPSKLGVEVGCILGHRRQRVVHLVEKCHGFIIQVLDGNPRSVPERHGPIGVERAPRIHAHREGGDPGVLPPAHGKEVAHRNLHGRFCLIIPVHAENREAPVACRRHPNVLNRARAVDLGHRVRRASGDIHRRADLPTSSEIPRGLGSGPFGCHPAFALVSGRVLRTAGPGRVLQTRPHPQALPTSRRLDPATHLTGAGARQVGNGCLRSAGCPDEAASRLSERQKIINRHCASNSEIILQLEDQFCGFPILAFWLASQHRWRKIMRATSSVALSLSTSKLLVSGTKIP